MKDLRFDSAILCILIGVLIGICIGWIICVCDYVPKTDAIERGFAEYNSTNGQWQWKSNFAGQHYTIRSKWKTSDPLLNGHFEITNATITVENKGEGK